MTAVKNFDCNVLMVNDSGLYCSKDLTLAWYAGTYELPLQNILKDILKVFSNKYGTKKTILYGGSGGGFAAIFYGSCLPNSIVVATNPQTDISKYHPSSVALYIEKCFNLNIQRKKFADFFKKCKVIHELSDSFLNGSCNLYYLQNSYDEHHCKIHLASFMQKLKINYLYNQLIQKINSRITLILGANWGHGHISPPKEFIFGFMDILLHSSDNKIYSNDIKNLYDKTASLINNASIEIKNGKIIGCVEPINEIKNINYKTAWYLYHDGVCILKTGYLYKEYIEFDCQILSGIYRATAFIKNGNIRSSMKTKKLFLQSQTHDL
jgi:hypothetical protein